MDFVFEVVKDDGSFWNFVDCTDINMSGIRRFTPCPLVTELVQLNSRLESITVNITTEIPKDKTYVIPTGVAHSPDFWTGKLPNTPSQKTILDWLPKRYYDDLKNKKAFLLIDQSHEGYHEPWLFKYFHEDCEKHEISPEQIIYVTGNMRVTDQYNRWARKNGIVEKLFTMPYPHFEFAVSSSKVDTLPTYIKQLNTKTKKIKKLKVYNCLQKRPRNHRIWLFTRLYEEGLLDDGINSMNEFEFHKTYMDGKHLSEQQFNNCSKLLPMLPPSDDPSKLPEFESGDCGQYLMKFNEDIMLQSIISIISEASFDDNLDTTFLSEKTFKTIMCSHPFIIYGNKYSLKYLKQLGYKTFSPFINESYDELDNWERLELIIKEIKRFKEKTHEERIEFYKRILDVLRHNQEHLKKRKNTISTETMRMMNYIKENNSKCTEK